MSNVKIQAKEIKMVSIDSLIPSPKNNNKHPKEQKDRLKKIIKNTGFRVPIEVSNRSGFVTCGHLRLECAKELGMQEVPVIYQDFKDEATEYAHLTAENEIARWAELDMDMVKIEMKDLDFDMDFLGIENFDLIEEGESTGSGEELYTRKVESPIYEPHGEKPETRELYDPEKYHSLIKEIKKSSLSEEMKNYLSFAASRHVKFNYKLAAEYYAHATKEEQELMENSALIIIDFDKAIEKGFVKMTQKFKEAYETE